MTYRLWITVSLMYNSSSDDCGQHFCAPQGRGSSKTFLHSGYPIHSLEAHVLKPESTEIPSSLLYTIVVGCSLTFSCTPKDVKVHTDDNGAIVLLTNRTSF